jgi:flagellar biogenesis protein FliO
MEVARQVSSVLVVLALLGMALWLLRRASAAPVRGLLRRGPRRPRSLEPVERLSLTQQHSIHLVRIHGRELLVATHPQGCTLLHDETLGGSA